MDNTIENINDIDNQAIKHTPIIDHRILAGKLVVYNWLKDVPTVTATPEVVEVRFKNTRKAFFSNPSKLNIKEGDIVAVEAALGHDIGIVSLAGELVKEQIRLKRIDLERTRLRKCIDVLNQMIYRIGNKLSHLSTIR